MAIVTKSIRLYPRREVPSQALSLLVSDLYIHIMGPFPFHRRENGALGIWGPNIRSRGKKRSQARTHMCPYQRPLKSESTARHSAVDASECVSQDSRWLGPSKISGAPVPTPTLYSHHWPQTPAAICLWSWASCPPDLNFKTSSLFCL